MEFLASRLNKLVIVQFCTKLWKRGKEIRDTKYTVRVCVGGIKNSAYVVRG